MDRSALSEALARDRALKLAGAIYLVVAAVYLLPAVTFEIREWLAWYLWTPLLLVVTIGAIQYGLARAEDAAGRRFWNWVTTALGLWLVGASVEAAVPELRDEILGSLVVDCIYASYYLTLVFATEIRPDLGDAGRRSGREEELHRGSTVSFILALLIYCSVIPSQRNPEEYLTGRFSVLLYLCLEIFFLARFAYLAGVASSPRWRTVYRFLFLAYASSVVLLVAQFHALVTPSPLPGYVGTAWDLPWYLPLAAVLLAARVSRYVEQERAAPASDSESLAPRVWEPMAFYAIVFPLLHLVLDFYGQLSAPSRGVQQGLVVVYFVFFGFLALVQAAGREKKKRMAERALRESERRYRQLIESHPDAILIEQQGRIVFANAAGAAKLGLDPAAEDRSLASLGFPAPPPAGTVASAVPIDCRLSGARGEEIDLEVSYFDVSYLGRPARQAIARDVTEAKRQRAESERLARLASLGQFSAAMAHEIRNPLAAIVMHSFFLAERLAKDEENLRTLADINAAVDRMQKLVDGILSFVRPSALHFVEEDLIALVDSARLDLARQLNLDGIAVVEDYRHYDATVEVDVGQMVAVLTHVLDNAVHAMPDGGTLTLRSRNPAEDRVEVVIEDTGCGIAQEDLGRVFEPFFSRRDDGVGLGMALAGRILDLHACRYRLASEPGSGSRFILDFALAGSPAEPTSPTDPPAADQRGERDKKKSPLHRERESADEGSDVRSR